MLKVPSRCRAIQLHYFCNILVHKLLSTFLCVPCLLLLDLSLDYTKCLPLHLLPYEYLPHNFCVILIKDFGSDMGSLEREIIFSFSFVFFDFSDYNIITACPSFPFLPPSRTLNPLCSPSNSYPFLN